LLEGDSVRERVKRIIAKSKSPFIEVHIEERQGVDIRYGGKELEALHQYIDMGGNVRAYSKGFWSFASFNDLDDLEENLAFVDRQVKTGGVECQGKLARVNPITDEIVLKLDDDPRNVSLEEKIRVADGYNKSIMCSKRIQTSKVNYCDSFRRRYYLNSDGADIVEEKCYCGIGFTAFAKDGINVQVRRRSVASTRGFDTVRNLEAEVEQTIKDAIDLLAAEKVKAGVYTVVVDPFLAGIFAHEAFGHLSEADFVQENKKMQSIMKLGEKFGSPTLTIIDDATIPGERGSYRYDDEGVPAQKTYLIRNGVLVGRLHSRESAGKMSERSTGNARAITYRHAPIVRMSNTYIAKGRSSFDELIGGIDNGIYAIGALGGQTQLEMFTFSSAKAYMINDGKIGKLVRDVILTGNVFETIKAIDGIGNDTEFHGGLGGCGKGGQYPLPVSHGGSHIRIRNVVIGGN
jgi:TldD protein